LTGKKVTDLLSLLGGCGRDGIGLGESCGLFLALLQIVLLLLPYLGLWGFVAHGGPPLVRVINENNDRPIISLTAKVQHRLDLAANISRNGCLWIGLSGAVQAGSNFRHQYANFCSFITLAH
jgi:hypothetical protein